jgi:hypothetical protein
MAQAGWFYALTLTGDERHVFNPLPDRPGYLPTDGLALCGKLVRYRLRSQPWADAIPRCRLCVARGATLSSPPPAADAANKAAVVPAPLSLAVGRIQSYCGRVDRPHAGHVWTTDPGRWCPGDEMPGRPEPHSGTTGSSASTPEGL